MEIKSNDNDNISSLHAQLSFPSPNVLIYEQMWMDIPLKFLLKFESLSANRWIFLLIFIMDVHFYSKRNIYQMAFNGIDDRSCV